MSSNIVDFYLSPLREAIDFYRQLIKYGDYDPERYLRPVGETLTAKEALRKSRPMRVVMNNELEKELVDSITKEINRAVKYGKFQIELRVGSNFDENERESRLNVAKHFKDLGYTFKYVTVLRQECALDDLFARNLIVAWKQ